MTDFWKISFAMVALVVALTAQTESGPSTSLVPEGERFYPPTAARIASIHAIGQRGGWKAVSGSLRETALRAYESDKLAAAESWYQLYRWMQLWGKSENEPTREWSEARDRVKVALDRSNRPILGEGRLLGESVPKDLQLWLMTNAKFSEEFFSLLTPFDALPAVFSILTDLDRKDPVHFKSHSSLALAIALVYDVKPPANWPHGQVTTAALSRQMPEPSAAFAWWLRQEQLGFTYHPLSRLKAEELKFVVDATAPFSELEWARQRVKLPLNQLEQVYPMVRYRTERVVDHALVWPGRTYTLKDILNTGGICTDQAYFASQVGKARGVPTLFIAGAGDDSRHAWFGFLDGNRKWQLDAGRYAEQRFVTGFARDPQTWQEFSDHELQFMSERFREFPAFRQSQVHALFGAFYLRQQAPAAAALAARKAVSYEKRNQLGWDTLLAAAAMEQRPAKTLEAICREAALAFQRYPDLEAEYVTRVAESLRARGETSLATAELSRLRGKYQSARSDLTVQQARATLQHSFNQPLAQQIQTYNTLVDTVGRGAGLAFFDQVVVPFVDHLMQRSQRAEAVKAVERARRTLKVEPNRQLEQEVDGLLRELKARQ